MPEDILPEIPGTESILTYKIDGVPFLNLGVYVSTSKGMQDIPTMKEPQTVDWPDSHGTVVDLAAPRYNNREIELECFIRASGKLDFFNKVRTFLEIFQKPGLRTLELHIASKPLIYMVYTVDGVNIDKHWHEGEMFGTFTLKLIEPSPIKRLLVRTSTTVSLQFTSNDPIDIYWGDGQKTLNVFGTSVLKSHTYTVAGPHYILLCGVIEEIEDFVKTNADVVWNKY